MEGDSNGAGANDMDIPGNDYPPDESLGDQGFLNLQATSDLDSKDDTKSDSEDDELDPILCPGETLLILEQVDLDREHTRCVLFPVTPYRTETSAASEDLHGCKNGDLESPGSLSCRFECHTSNVSHHYCTWHGSKYCCRSTQPNRDVICPTREEFFDDCLNYLECSDVMTDYTNGIWTSALLGNEPFFLLEGDQDDETQVSQNSRKECDVLLSAATRVNEGSDNAMDKFTSSCVSHSEPPAVAERKDFPGDSVYGPEPAMVLIVDHQQDNLPSLKRQGRCGRLHSASTDIQDDQVDVEVENMKESPGECRPASIKHNIKNPYVELYIVNVLGDAMAGLISLAEDSSSDSVLCSISENKKQKDSTLTLEGDILDQKHPEICEEMNRLSLEENFDQLNEQSTKKERVTEKPLVPLLECSGNLLDEEESSSDRTNSTAEDPSQLLQFLKENIQHCEVSGMSNDVQRLKVGDHIQVLENDEKCPSGSENQECHSLEKNKQSIEECNDNTKSIDEFPIEVLENDVHVLEMMDSGLQTTDSEHQILETVSPNSTCLMEHEETMSNNNEGENKKSIKSEMSITFQKSEINDLTEYLLENVEQGTEDMDCELQTDDNEQNILNSICENVDSTFRLGNQKASDNEDCELPGLELPIIFQNSFMNEVVTDKVETVESEQEFLDGVSEGHESTTSNNISSESMETDILKPSISCKTSEENDRSENVTINIDTGLQAVDGVSDPTFFDDVSHVLDCPLQLAELERSIKDNDNSSEKNETSDSELPLFCQNNEMLDNVSQIEDSEFEIQDSRLHILDSEPNYLGDISEIVDSSLIMSHTDSIKEVACLPEDPVINVLENVDTLEIVDTGLQTSESNVFQIVESTLEEVSGDSLTCKISSDDICENLFFATEQSNDCETSCLNKEVEEPTNSLVNAMEDSAIKTEDLCDQPQGGKPKMPDVLHDPKKCVKPTGDSCRFIIKRSLSFDDALSINSIKNIFGKLIKRNALDQQVEDTMHSKKKAIRKSLSGSFCCPITEGDHGMINKDVAEKYQEAFFENCCRSGDTEMLSLTKTAMPTNSTEIEKAHSLHVKDYIPNSQELSQVCEDPDTIRGIQLVRAQSIDLDQTRGASCSLRFKSSTNFCEKSTDSKMVKKKFKSGEKVHKNAQNEAQALDVNEGFPPEEEKRLKRQNSIDTAPLKDSKKAPKLLHDIQAEMFPDCSGNLKLFCHFGEIHADSTVTWTKDSKLLARMHRSPNDDSPVSLAIVQTSKKDQGLYQCTIKNMHGKVITEFHLTAEVLEQLTCYQDVEVSSLMKQSFRPPV